MTQVAFWSHLDLEIAMFFPSFFQGWPGKRDWTKSDMWKQYSGKQAQRFHPLGFIACTMWNSYLSTTVSFTLVWTRMLRPTIQTPPSLFPSLPPSFPLPPYLSHPSISIPLLPSLPFSIHSSTNVHPSMFIHPCISIYIPSIYSFIYFNSRICYLKI